MGDLVWVIIFSQTSLELRNFFPRHMTVKDFISSALYVMSDIFFSTGYFIFPRNLFTSYFLSKSICRIFFSEITHNPSKVK